MDRSLPLPLTLAISMTMALWGLIIKGDNLKSEVILRVTLVGLSLGSDMSNSIHNRVIICNPHVPSMKVDVLYHVGLDTDTTDLKKQFGDVKFVIMGGSPKRMKKIAERLLKALDVQLPCGTGLANIACASDRYEMYKVGPILTVSHGMGVPSISILLHEMAKLLYHAGCQDVSFIRLGTCGGIGLEPGSVVITTSCLDCAFNDYFQLKILGKTVRRPAHLDEHLVKELIETAESMKPDFNVVAGKTMCADDFYEEQGRLDGAICEYTEEEKMVFLKKAYDCGVRNFEMESLGFAAFCQHLKIKAAVICVTLVNRLVSDQISTPLEIMHAWQERPLEILINYIKNQI
ncbi:uridine phosphorylase 1 [Echinococcus multilocularis]|uniref:Uridine phosphorylase 1 n=1 Tax=Echinococcus multilocularis TaxID=6211 RepID=A0A068Y5H2_ECHMU|nr:uridine phosphorylase 1 [Echinococcus multilocularis]